MGTLADRLNNLHLETVSPDGQLIGVYNARTGVSVEFLKGSYRHYTERSLEQQLSQLATRLWASYRRGYDAALEEAVGAPVETPKEIADPHRRRFNAERAETVFEGMSVGKHVYIQHTGTRNWRLVVRDGSLSILDETRFNEEINSAFHAMREDCRVKTAELRDRHLRALVA